MFSINFRQWSPGPRFNIKMTSYWYRKSHCGDKTILRPSYLHNGISYTGKSTSLYWFGALWFSHEGNFTEMLKISIIRVCCKILHLNVSPFLSWDNELRYTMDIEILVITIYLEVLIYWDWGKMAAVLYTPFPNSFPCLKFLVFWLAFVPKWASQQ